MIIATAILGLTLGSFLNVVIYRLPRHMSLMGPRSMCPSCGTMIRFYDNIPVFSFLLLGRKCRQCGALISWRYPLVEMLTAGLLVLMLLRFGPTIEFVKYSILTLILIPVTFIDLDEKIIPNWLTFSGFAAGIAFTLIFQFELWRFMLLGLVSGGIFMTIIMILGKWLFKKDAMGMGDVKLLVMIGVYVGMTGTFLIIYLAAVIAFFIIIIPMILKKINLGAQIPFGPFIAMGTLVYVLIGADLIDWYRQLVTG